MTMQKPKYIYNFYKIINNNINNKTNNNTYIKFKYKILNYWSQRKLTS